MKPVRGWGRTPISSADTITLASSDPEFELAALLQSPGSRRTLARGLGRSYGDTALAAGGTLIDRMSWRTPMELDPQASTITLGAGWSLGEVLQTVVEHGFFLPVTPGTQHVTIGGAIAADVHGKNHHRDGSFGDHLCSIRLVTPTGVHDLEPGDPRFAATQGGLGLTGVITSATIRLLRIPTSYLDVTTRATADLTETFAQMDEHDQNHRYSVAWIDASALGSRLGRGILTWADHARLDQLPDRALRDPLTLDSSPHLRVPIEAPNALLSPLSIRVFNEAWYRLGARAPLHQIEPVLPYFYPLDNLQDWNLLYGSRGFLQYQVVVPFGAERTIERILERLAQAKMPSFLSVLKRFGPSSAGYLSFPRSGWTLALDLPARREKLSHLLDDLDHDVVATGGRVYLAKDSRLKHGPFTQMYLELERFRTVADSLDPDRLFESDLARRLGIRTPLRSNTP
ncbi:MAG: FAD-binding oxidoreductase [Ferrimicrobium sp.]